MNILYEALPNAIEIDGQEYEINSDFRSCLKIITAFEDGELTDVEKQMILIKILYKEVPVSLEQAILKGIKFLNGGKDEAKEESGPRLYSFEQDASYIMAAFKQTHNIDLDTADLHWWKFMALFMDLGPDTTFSNLVSLRKRIKTGKATKEERQAAREIWDIFNIPEHHTIEEREAEDDFMRRFRKGKQKCNTMDLSK